MPSSAAEKKSTGEYGQTVSDRVVVDPDCSDTRRDSDTCMDPPGRCKPVYDMEWYERARSRWLDTQGFLYRCLIASDLDDLALVEEPPGGEEDDGYRVLRRIFRTHMKHTMELRVALDQISSCAEDTQAIHKQIGRLHALRRKQEIEYADVTGRIGTLHTGEQTQQKRADRQAHVTEQLANQPAALETLAPDRRDDEPRTRIETLTTILERIYGEVYNSHRHGSAHPRAHPDHHHTTMPPTTNGETGSPGTV